MMGGPCRTHDGMRYMHKNLVEKAEGKKSLGRLKHSWENNNKVELK
jgi:hypothetical protein